MRTAIFPDTRPSPARNFALRAAAWTLGLFGVLRLGVFERFVVLPFTALQAAVAERIVGAPAQPIAVTLECSGTDALALCVGVILAFPAPWISRLTGAALGVLVILVLNIMRIGTLGLVVGDPSLFDVLHLTVWPAMLMLTIAGYVFSWMYLVTGGTYRPAARFVLVTLAFLLIFTLSAPLYLASESVLAIAGFIARASAWTLRAAGIEAAAFGNALVTARGGFAVTQECVSTPLIPVYLAAIMTWRAHWRWRTLGVLAAIPLFIALGIARLLVVALPGVLVESPLALVHAFYQLVLAAVLIGLTAFWSSDNMRRSWMRASAGMAIAFGLMYLLAGPYEAAIAWTGSTHRALPDPQGALALLPGYQAGLFAGLLVSACVTLPWRAALLGVAALVGLQAACLIAYGVGVSSFAFTPHVRDVRAWSVLVPVLVVRGMVLYARRAR